MEIINMIFINTHKKGIWSLIAGIFVAYFCRYLLPVDDKET